MCVFTFTLTLLRLPSTLNTDLKTWDRDRHPVAWQLCRKLADALNSIQAHLLIHLPPVLEGLIEVFRRFKLGVYFVRDAHVAAVWRRNAGEQERRQTYREARMAAVSRMALSRLIPSGQRPSLIHLHSSNVQSGVSHSLLNERMNEDA